MESIMVELGGLGAYHDLPERLPHLQSKCRQAQPQA